MLLTGLVGRPVSHSIGQTLYNRFYASSGIESMYLSIDITPGNLSRFAEFSREHFIGYNVTIPHKISIMNCLEGVDENASSIGAVNLVRNEESGPRGYNTDYLAMASLGARSGLDFGSSRIAVRGSGGVSRTVLYYISKNHPGAEVTLISRDPAAAGKSLPGYDFEIPMSIVGPEGLSEHSGFDILINCSPVGMWPNIEGRPFSENLISECKAGIDLVYNPVETSFIKALEEEGKTAVDGFGFFVDQGYESMRLFFGDKVDEKLFRKTAEEIMSEIGGNGQGKN